MTPSRAPNPRNLVPNTVIQHDSFERMLNRLDQLWADAVAHVPFVAPFTGETGTGKTTAAETFVRKHPPRRAPDGLIIPVLLVRTPSKPTPRNLGERILQQLGDPRATAGSATAKLDRIVTNIEQSEVLFVILDDGQHFVDKRQNVAIFDAADYLKELIVGTNVGLALIGLPELKVMLKSNEQVSTRSKAVFELKRFDWINRASQDQFVGVLAAFQDALHAYELPDLASPDISLRMYCATGGLIRNVAKILGAAVGHAIDASTTKINLGDLETAWSEEIFNTSDDRANPFERAYLLTDLATKITKAKTIGQRVDRPEPQRRRKAKAELAEIGL